MCDVRWVVELLPLFIGPELQQMGIDPIMEATIHLHTLLNLLSPNNVNLLV